MTVDTHSGWGGGKPKYVGPCKVGGGSRDSGFKFQMYYWSSTYISLFLYKIAVYIIILTYLDDVGGFFFSICLTMSVNSLEPEVICRGLSIGRLRRGPRGCSAQYYTLLCYKIAVILTYLDDVGGFFFSICLTMSVNSLEPEVICRGLSIGRLRRGPRGCSAQ